jgi:hypothetical protein
MLRSVPLFFSLCLFAAGAAAQEPARDAAHAYAADLIAEADQRALDRDPYWLLLLHARHNLSGGFESRVDDPAFFVAPDGKRDPRAELHALLRAMADPTGQDKPDHPVQKFPARVAWLKEQLDIDASRMPPPARTRFDDLWAQMRPVAATLVFPACNLNNPASMFGHTLIVFDSQDRNRLLSQSVSYAGRTDGGFSPLFIVGCFIGSFPGYYGVMPYYDKVELYGDIGYRDIWEYELDLTPEELRRMLMHTWELQGVRSDYYFLTENCAFNLLFVIDTARPSLQLTRTRQPWVTPIDVLKEVCGRGLVRQTAFRPSKVTSLQYLTSLLSQELWELAHAVAVDGQDAESVAAQVSDPEQQIVILDLAAQLVQYRYTQRTIPPEQYRRDILRILRVRSRLARPSDEVYRVPEPPRPETGHDGNRLALGGGSENGDGFLSLRYRPAYHAISDPGTGFDPGFHMQFLDAEVRMDTQNDTWKLEHLAAIDILSAAPCDRFFKPKSWQASVGLMRRRLAEDDDSLVGYGEVGFGYAARWKGAGLAYLLMNVRAELGDPYNDHYAAGGGPSAGVIFTPMDRWRLVLQGDGACLAGRDQDILLYQLSLRQSLSLTRNTSVGLDCWYGETDGYESHGGTASWSLYF